MAYRIEQTGAELQGILNDAAVTKQGLENEVARAQAAEGVLQENIDSEAGARQGADALLAGNIGTEVARAQQAESDLSVRVDANAAGVAAEVARAQEAEGQVWDTLNDEILTRQSQDAALQGNIEREAGLREAGDGQLQGEIDAISGKIPTSASENNKLVDAVSLDTKIGGKADKAATLAGYGIEDAYTKDAVDEMIETLSRNEVVVGALPQTGEEGLIYRVPGNGYYTDYMYYDGEFVELSQYSMEFDQTQVGYFTCDTAAGTAAKTVSAAGYTLAVGGNMRIRMTNVNTAANVTLNINGTGAKALYYDGEQASSTNTWEAGEVLEVYYDGTQYQCASGNNKSLIEDEYVIATAFSRFKNKVERQELEDDEEVIARAIGNHETRLQDLEGGGGGGGGGGSTSSLSGTITQATSDTICVIGSSFGIGYTTAGKHWVNIVDMFSDYAIQNLSADGSSNLTRLIALRGSGINPAKKAKFALLVNSENLGSNVNVIYQSFVNLAKVIMSYGIIPICGTSYRNISGFRQYNQYFSSLLRKFCKDNNTLFMDAAEYCTVVGQGYNFERPGNTHLGTRQIPLVAYAYMDALRGLERPYQSVKTFTKREEVTVDSLDDLMFSDNYGRAKLFKLSNTFADYALISAVLPATARNLKTLKLSFITDEEVEVYVINTNAEPYPTVNNYTRFHVDETITVPSMGDTYTYNGSTFTVVYVETTNPYGAYCDIYCSPKLSEPSDVSGTLTKVSGSGSSSIAFNGYGIASLDYSAAVTSDTIGHWELVEADEDGMYSIVNPIGRVFVDKVHFLIKHSGSFLLSGASVIWSADQLKNMQRTPVPDFYANSWMKNEELVTEPTFGEIGTTQTSWIDENGDAVVSQSNYEYTLTGSSYLPSGCASIAKVGTTKSIETTVSNSGFRRNCKVMLEVIARCFGDGFVDGTDTVTSDTFDWGNLLVTIGVRNEEIRNTTYKSPVGLMWKIIRIPIDNVAQYNPYGVNDMVIRINADRDGFEVAKVSLKLLDYEIY